MHIAFITLHPFNSMLTVTREYCQILCKRGHRITVFAKGSYSGEHNIDNLFFREVCREYSNSKITHMIFILKLISILGKEKFDVIHINNAYGVAMLPICCRKASPLWLLDIRTSRIDGGIKGFLLDRVKVFESVFFTRIIVLSEGLKKNLFHNRMANRIFILPLGANIDKFKNTETNRNIWSLINIKQDDTILTYIGAIDRTRKIENMLEAFHIVLNKVKKVNLKLVIIGGANNRIKELKRKTAELSIDENVCFLGHISYDRIPEHMVNSDIGLSYIPKNRVYDCQPPLKTFEYLAASLPVVATDTSSNLDIIEDGINGIITTDDPADFANGILRLLQDQQLKNSVKARSAESIVEYDWENVVNHLLEIYQFQRKEKT